MKHLYQLSMSAKMSGCDGDIQHISNIVFESRARAEKELPSWLERVKETPEAQVFGIEESTIKTRIIELEMVPG